MTINMCPEVQVKVETNVGDIGFRKVAMINYDVSDLDISGCKRITDLSVSVIQSLARLAHVNVSGSGITLDGLVQLLQSNKFKVTFVDRHITIKEKGVP